ncbi:hypothetical protein IWW39_002731 [Coemansia spiralis]|uniref:Uncharacterized protein n=1 Tax=Coemansia spiralis TaxID=417178 RepID=A0A9W8L491_9FUNG|nr:hypothetical protein IWW39_002731 [Coemansia spiralis]
MPDLSVISGGSEGTPPSPPSERHPSNDDWGTTITAIALMTLLAFIALGALIKKSFQLVPTGVLALRTLVSDRPAGYHQLDPNDSDEETGALTREESSATDNRRFEILRDEESIDDYREEPDEAGDSARIIRIED